MHGTCTNLLKFSCIIYNGPIPMLEMLAWNGDSWIGGVMGFGFDC